MPRSKEDYAKMRAEAQEKILNTAIDVFSKKGFSGSSIKDIAEAANISSGLLYRYFQSKQDLFDRIIDYAVEGLKELVHLVANSETPKKTLEILCQEIIDYMGDETYLKLNSMIVQGILSQDSPAYEKILVVDKKLIEALTNLIKKGQEQGDFTRGDPAAKTYLFMSAIQGIVIMKITFRDKCVLPTAAEMMAHLSVGER